MNTYQNRLVDSFFRFMKNWSTELKKAIIVKLTQSIEDQAKPDRDFSACFGAWEDSRSAEEIIQEIRAGRVNTREIEDL